MKIQYISDDGQVFDSKESCLAHENGFIQQLSADFKKCLTPKHVFELDYNDLDVFITKFLKHKGFHDNNFDKHGYECVAENEWGNDQSHSFNVVPEKPAGQIKYMATCDLLDWMCAEGIIDAGEYIVDVSW